VRRAHRYGFSVELTTDEVYGSPGEPGCLRVWMPAGAPWDRSLRALRVPVHTHDSDHITVVTEGRATFLVVREVAGKKVLIMADMGPGSMVFYPAHVPHTFVADEAFEVASLQASYKAPERLDFAPAVQEGVEGLPRWTFEAFRREMAAVPVPS
jgi:mannose-6-phosphate isomerase-like protein (cupin superfamily)